MATNKATKFHFLTKLHGVLRLIGWVACPAGILLNFIYPQSSWPNFLIFPPIMFSAGFALTSFRTLRKGPAYKVCLLWLAIANAILGYRLLYRLPTGGLAVFALCLIALLAGVITSYPQHARLREV
jgi:hypothetical protein